MEEHGGFEGNAQTLRMLTDTIFSSQRKGMDPTRALVDGVLKYRTVHGELEGLKNHFLYGEQRAELEFVHDGRPFPGDLAPGNLRDGFRSIECEIMDWADDTAYSLNDVADGIRAGFIEPGRVERWAGEAGLSPGDGECLEGLLGAMRDGRVEALMGRKIGDFIAACGLRTEENFMSEATERHRFRLVVSKEVRRESKMYKKLALDLVFRSEKLHQLDRKTDMMLRQLFEIYAENYIEPDRGKGAQWNLLAPEDARLIAEAPDRRTRARLVCDYLAAMTDTIATRIYKRLFDPDFGSIVDLV